MGRSKIAFLLCMMMVVHGSSFMVVKSSSINNLKNQQESLESNIKKAEQEIQSITIKQKKLVQELDVIAQKELEIGNNIEKVDGQITAKAKEITKTEKELEDAQKVEDQHYLSLEARIKYYYENPVKNFFQMLLESKSIADFYRRQEYMKAIAEYDRQMNKDFENSRKKVAESKVKLESEKEALAKLQGQNQSQLAEQKEVRLLKTAAREKLDDEKVSLEGRKENLENERKEIEGLIKKKLAELRLQQFNGKLGLPVTVTPYVTSPFGYRKDPFTGERWYHYGVDFRAPTGTKIVAAADGKVILSAWKGGYGYAVMIAHGSNLVTLYGHNSKLLVKSGDQVVKGQTIALAGSTGRSTGPHCHFETRVNGGFEDPMKWLKKQ